ncbi:hypothetical protein DJ564_23345 [Pseudomonas sp. 31-12]|uniref:hypothetical protein n=1 Tax=Pseudomonas TaxID=286 RepID=UPI000D6CF85B|nr:hypothetical protein [Pseudomonas sp. 31-12]AWM93510.1 hypothetical protein DJ564_23345 [Pseudomonas sp. 31-12]
MQYASPHLETDLSVSTARYIRLLAIISVSLIPAVMTIIATLIASRGQWQNVLPSWSDEIMHWHQVATAIRAGLEGGYYTLWEQPAPLEAFHFYAWGPWLYLIYAIPGSLFGWEPYSFPLFNLTALTLALAGFCWTARLNGRQLGMLALIMLTFWPGLLHYPLSMLETLHYALAVMLAALCIPLWRRGEHASLALKVGVLVFIAFISLLRPSWVIVLLPCLLLMLAPTRKMFLLSLIVTVVVGLALMILFEQVRAPYLLGGQGILAIGHPLNAYLNRIVENLAGFFSPLKTPAEIAFTLQLLFVLGLAVFALVGIKRFQWLTCQEGVFHFLNLGGILAACIVFFHAGFWHDFRLMSAQLLLSMLVLLYFKRYVPLVLIVITSLLFLPGVLTTFQERIDSKMLKNQTDLAAFKASLRDHLVYDPLETNPWCNTLNMGVESFDADLIEVPAGIGITFFVSNSDPMPMRSRYWLLRPGVAEVLQSANPNSSLASIAKTPIGTLYRNDMVDCKSR